MLEPFKALMMIMGMGVKGSGEAESWLGKATGVESEISGTVEKNGGGDPKELGRSTEEGEGERKTNQECDRRINLTRTKIVMKTPPETQGEMKSQHQGGATPGTLFPLQPRVTVCPAAQQQMLLVSCPHRLTLS